MNLLFLFLSAAFAQSYPAYEPPTPVRHAPTQAEILELQTAVTQAYLTLHAQYAYPEKLTDATRAQLVQGAISGMLKPLNDPYLEYHAPADHAQIRTALTDQQVDYAVVLTYAHDVPVVHIPMLTRTTPAELRALLSTLPQNAPHVVLDLRGTPGGLVTAVGPTAGVLVGPGHILFTEQANYGRVMYHSSGAQGVGAETQFHLLYDEKTASAAEMLIGGIMNFEHVHTYAPSHSKGKGTIQEFFPVHTGQLRLTTATWRPTNGTLVQGVGIFPETIMHAKSQGDMLDEIIQKIRNK